MLFPGAMANAMYIKTGDRTWHFLFTLRHHRLLVFVQTRTDVSISGFGYVQRVLGARWTVEITIFISVSLPKLRQPVNTLRAN